MAKDQAATAAWSFGRRADSRDDIATATLRRGLTASGSCPSRWPREKERAVENTNQTVQLTHTAYPSGENRGGHDGGRSGSFPSSAKDLRLRLRVLG